MKEGRRGWLTETVTMTATAARSTRGRNGHPDNVVKRGASVGLGLELDVARSKLLLSCHPRLPRGWCTFEFIPTTDRS
jgi:hypothetical protein